MATAKRTTKTVRKVITEEAPDGVDLHLSENEAEALAGILRRVGGTPHLTRRGYAALILKAIRSVDIAASVEAGDLIGGDLVFTNLRSSDSRLVELAAAKGL
jgi:hypothetical protein